VSKDTSSRFMLKQQCEFLWDDEGNVTTPESTTTTLMAHQMHLQCLINARCTIRVSPGGAPVRRGHVLPDVLPWAPTSFLSLPQSGELCELLKCAIHIASCCVLLFQHHGHVVVLFEGKHSS
jgi:hypothetical protein